MPPSADSPLIPIFVSRPADLTYATATAPSNNQREHWISAMEEEMASLRGHATWYLTPRLPGMKVLPVRWVYTTKLDAMGEVERYKARLVAKGFMQRPGLEFTEVFAPVTSKATLRMLLATVVTQKKFIRQLDVKTAFLNGKLDPDLNVYMAQPEGFEEPGDLVCKLVRSLYGLKQAPRMWSQELARVLNAAGFRASTVDPALFFRKEAGGS